MQMKSSSFLCKYCYPCIIFTVYNIQLSFLFSTAFSLILHNSHFSGNYYNVQYLSSLYFPFWFTLFWIIQLFTLKLLLAVWIVQSCNCWGWVKSGTPISTSMMLMNIGTQIKIILDNYLMHPPFFNRYPQNWKWYHSSSHYI